LCLGGVAQFVNVVFFVVDRNVWHFYVALIVL
jgi:hypothetical protein